MSFPSRFIGVDAARARFGPRVDRVGAFLSQGDPLADQVVETSAEMPPGEGFRLFSRAAAQGIASVPEAPESFRAFFTETERVPVWVDPDRMERGRRLFLRYGMLAGIVLGGRSLVLGYISPAGNKPLVFSGRLEQQAPRRLAETGRFVQAISEYRGVDVLGDGYQIALKVRLMHAQVRAMLARSNRWNTEAWGVPINQHDMAGTTLLFSIAVLDGLRTLGARFSASEADDYMHLWRVIGRLMGVHDEILPASEADAFALAEIIAATQEPPDDDARSLTRALLRTPLEAARTDLEKLVAPERVKFGAAVTRMLLGDELADDLHLVKSNYHRLLPVLRGITRTRDLVLRVSPSRRAAAEREGERYWQDVVQRSLEGKPAEFRPPEKLERPSPASAGESSPRPSLRDKAENLRAFAGSLRRAVAG